MSTLAPGEGGGAKASLTTAEGYLPALCGAGGERRKLGKRQVAPKGLGLACVGGSAPKTYSQPTLFAAGDSEKSIRLMQVMDQLNRICGRGTLFHAREGVPKAEP